MLCGLAAGTTDGFSPDPITDRMRYELALAQRDYVVTKQQLDAVTAVLKEKLEAAEKACATQKAAFDAVKFVCKANGSSLQRDTLQRDTETKQP